ncbi:hypothetical protein [Aquimarina megaterium]|uniref:hypothetical protein n=1 Tax=Aquimarina megaterium TaxID=1443666 RepID=UPI000470E99C|nr:hypothetical protein [Aquimarina megaterium]
MKENRDYIVEANRITDYLISAPLKRKEESNYVSAMTQFNLQLTIYEQRLLSNMLKSKWRMACIDGGLAIKDPNNIVRRKIFTMLAILEASPNYTMFFLSQRYSFFYFFRLGMVGFRAVFRALFGVIIITNIRSKCS